MRGTRAERDGEQGAAGRGWVRPRGLLIGAAAAAILSCGAAAMQGAPPAASKVPGAVNGVAGHVPDQNEQAQSAPVTRSEGAPAAQWWSPGDGRSLPEFVTYDDPYGQVGIYNQSGAV